MHPVPQHLLVLPCCSMVLQAFHSGDVAKVVFMDRASWPEVTFHLVTTVRPDGDEAVDPWDAPMHPTHHPTITSPAVAPGP